MIGCVLKNLFYLSKLLCLHVAAKRYLCATEPGYAAALSPASVYTLGVQGGPMRGAELAEFAVNPHAAAAIRVRLCTGTTANSEPTEVAPQLAEAAQ